MIGEIHFSFATFLFLGDSKTRFFIPWMRADPDPKHHFYPKLYTENSHEE